MTTGTFYTVELEVEQQQEEDFWMYRVFISKKKAMKAAKICSRFLPYYLYPTTIKVVEEQIKNGNLVYKKTLKSYTLENE